MEVMVVLEAMGATVDLEDLEAMVVPGAMAVLGAMVLEATDGAPIVSEATTTATTTTGRATTITDRATTTTDPATTTAVTMLTTAISIAVLTTTAINSTTTPPLPLLT